MSSLRLLGYTGSKPCSFVIDHASPHSQVSAAFLFQNSFHQHLDVTGYNHSYLGVCVPTQGGYYLSADVLLVSSATCACDVILGADWVASCCVAMVENVLRLPAQEMLTNLPDGHRWIADGRPTFQARRCLLNILIDRFLPFSLLHTHDDQYCFESDLGNQPSSWPPPPQHLPLYQIVGTDPQGGPYTMAGFHEQAILDANCQRIALSPPVPSTGGNLNRHDNKHWGRRAIYPVGTL